MSLTLCTIGNHGLPLPVNCWLTVHVRMKCTHLNCNDNSTEYSYNNRLSPTYRHNVGTFLNNKNREMVTIKLVADNIRKTNSRLNETSCQPTDQHHAPHSAKSSSLQEWIMYREVWTRLGDRQMMTSYSLMCVCVLVTVCVCVQTFSFEWYVQKHIFDRWTHTNILFMDFFHIVKK